MCQIPLHLGINVSIHILAYSYWVYIGYKYTGYFEVSVLPRYRIKRWKAKLHRCQKQFLQ